MSHSNKLARSGIKMTFILALLSSIGSAQPRFKDEMGNSSKPTTDILPVGSLSTAGVSRIFAGIDSQTAGGGPGKDSYFTYLIPLLRAQLGDAGPGYIAFDLSVMYFFNWSLGFAVSPGIAFLDPGPPSPLPPGSVPKKYSLEGKGVFTNAGSGGFVLLDPMRKWTSARVYYLKQPGGGTFRLLHMALGASDQSLITISTANQVFDLGWADLPADATNSGIQMDEITGVVCLFGADFSIQGTTGATFSLLGSGGIRTEDYAMLDPAFQAKWYAQLKPAIYLFNGGIADRAVQTAAEFAGNVTTIASNILSGSPTTQIVLITPSATRDENATALMSYIPVREELARANGWGYYSVRELLGTSNMAVDKEFMDPGDPFHPTTLGNKCIATGKARGLGLAGGAEEFGPSWATCPGVIGYVLPAGHTTDGMSYGQ